MKKILAITGCVILSFTAFSQDSATVDLSVKNFEIPTSPAFMLLDKAPSVIERPNTGRAFAVSVLNSFSENRGIPQNYAVEFTPYWFFKHPKLNALSYAGCKSNQKKPNGCKQKCFNQAGRGSFSAAIITTDDTSTSKSVTNLSFGLRTTLFTLRSAQQVKAIQQAHSTVVYRLKSQMERQNAAVPLALKVTNPAEYNKQVAAFLANDLADPDGTFAKALDLKPLVALDLAAGYNTFFLENDFYNHHLGRFGAWGTLNIAIPLDRDSVKDGSSGNYLHVYGVGRYLVDGTQPETDSTYLRREYSDYGVKIEMEFKKLTFGYEYVARNGTGEYHTFRSTGTIAYQLSDHLFLTGAFGKNFGKTDNLISMFGINWGISTGNEQVIAKATN